MERWEEFGIKPCPIKELGKDNICVILIGSEERCKALHKFAWNWYAWSGMARLSQCETEMVTGSFMTPIKPGDWFLWYRKDEPYSQRQKELLFDLKDAFNAGYNFAMEPILTAEKAAKEAEEKEWREAMERMVEYFYRLDTVYEKPKLSSESVVLYRDYSYGGIQAYVCFNIPRDKRFPALYTPLPWRMAEKHGFHYSDWEVNGRGKTVKGEVCAELFVKHLRAWVEERPDDPANNIYLRIANAIGVLGK